MNKKGVLVAIIVAILCLGIGFGCSYMLLKSNVNETKCASPKEEKTSEEEYIEKIFKNTDIALKNEEDINYFISYVNETYGTSSFLVGEIYNEKMSNEFKLAYTIRALFNNNNRGGRETFLIKKSILEEAVSQVFADFSMEYIIALNFEFFGDVDTLVCLDDTCYIDYNDRTSQAGLTGLHDGYRTKIINIEEEDDKIIYTVKNFYVDYERNENEDGDFINYSMTLRTDAASKESLYFYEEFTLEDFDTYDELVKKVDETKLNTYKIMFDKTYRYLRTEKVN